MISGGVFRGKLWGVISCGEGRVGFAEISGLAGWQGL